MANLGPDDYVYYCVSLLVPGNMPAPTVSFRCGVDFIHSSSGAVVDSDLKYRFGADANPTNDTDPVGGAIDTGTDQDQTVSGNLIYSVAVQSSNQTYYGIAARQNKHATDDFESVSVANRYGGNPPTSGGVAIDVYSTSASDTSNLLLVFKSSSAWVSNTVQMTGTSHAISSNQIDANSDWYAVYNNGAVPVGDIYITVNGEIVGVIYGSASSGSVAAKQSYMTTTLYKIALATAQNTSLSSANRKTAPTGIGSFSRATYWPGNDSSIAVP